MKASIISLLIITSIALLWSCDSDYSAINKNVTFPEAVVQPDGVRFDYLMYENDYNGVPEDGDPTEYGNEEKQSDKSDDPIRMYLREMGGVELLSREGEIAIAKRIESGKYVMVSSLSESPVTAKKIFEWEERLINNEMLVRDIIDLDTNFLDDDKLKKSIKEKKEKEEKLKKKESKEKSE